MRRGLLASMLLAAALTAAVAPVRADDRPIGDTTAAAPIESLLERVRQDVEGDILEVELEREDEQENGAEILIYEVKVLTARGRVLELIYDARSLELLKVEGEKRGRRDHKDDDMDDDED